MESPQADCVGICFNVKQKEDKNYRMNIAVIDMKEERPDD
jgi:hypothetical protein